jgi:hypothetical protein
LKTVSGNLESLRRGGRRQGSGRKPLAETIECMWIVSQIRSIAEIEKITSMREHYAVKAQNPSHEEAHRELEEAYAKHKHVSLSESRRWIDNGTPADEIRELREEPGLALVIHLPTPNQFVMSHIYKTVANQASLHFAKVISPRKVKDCANAWVKYEKQLSTAV